MSKCFQKKKYKCNLANKLVREYLTFPENNKGVLIRIGVLFVIKYFKVGGSAVRQAFSNASIRRIK